MPLFPPSSSRAASCELPPEAKLGKEIKIQIKREFKFGREVLLSFFSSKPRPLLPGVFSPFGVNVSILQSPKLLLKLKEIKLWKGQLRGTNTCRDFPVKLWAAHRDYFQLIFFSDHRHKSYLPKPNRSAGWDYSEWRTKRWNMLLLPRPPVTNSEPWPCVPPPIDSMFILCMCLCFPCKYLYLDSI